MSKDEAVTLEWALDRIGTLSEALNRAAQQRNAAEAERDAARKAWGAWGPLIERIEALGTRDEIADDQFLLAQSLRLLKAAEAERNAALAREAAINSDYRAAVEALDDIREALGVPRGVFQSAADIARAARAVLATPAADLAAIRREAAERMRERAADVASDERSSRAPRLLDNDSHWGPIYRDRISAAIRALPLEEGEG